MRTKLLALLLATALVSSAFGESHQKMLDRVTGSVVRITGEVAVMTWAGPMRGSYVCSGFVIASERVLTAAHCLGDNMTADGQAVTVLKADEHYDLAVLRVATAKKPLRLRDKDVSRGDATSAIGYGWGFTAVTVVEGRVMLVNYQIPPDGRGRAYPALNFYQGAFIGGMSGGPVVDADGRVIGMVQMSGDGAGLGVGSIILRAFLLGVV